MSIRPLVTALSFVVFLLQACARQQSTRTYILFGKRDACSYINGQQYPYDWEGSDVGACVRKLPPQAQTVMVPDPIGGVFQVPQTEMNDNIWSISSPVGEGVGEFNGKYVVGVISTSQGDAEFVCAGVAVTGSSRGICGLR